MTKLGSGQGADRLMDLWTKVLYALFHTMCHIVYNQTLTHTATYQ